MSDDIPTISHRSPKLGVIPTTEWEERYKNAWDSTGFHKYILRQISMRLLVGELITRVGVESADIECADGMAKTIVVHGWKS